MANSFRPLPGDCPEKQSKSQRLLRLKKERRKQKKTGNEGSIWGPSAKKRMILVVMIASWGFVSQDVRKDFLQNPLKGFFSERVAPGDFYMNAFVQAWGAGKVSVSGCFQAAVSLLYLDVYLVLSTVGNWRGKVLVDKSNQLQTWERPGDCLF